MATNANAGRKALPPQLRVLNGRGTRKDGQETDSGGRPIPAAPPFARGNPEKPLVLSPDAEWLWDRVLEHMAAVGLLKPLDAAGLEVACETFARWREAVRFRRDNALLAKNSQGMVTAPWIGIEERASKDFRAWCSEFGFTPAAERHLIGGDGEDAGPGGNPF